MRAAVVDRYGSPEVVRVAEVPRPQARPGGVLVRVRAAAVTSADARIRAARFPAGFGFLARLAFGVVRPRRPILGGSFAGVVEAVGRGVSGLSPGDEVCGMTGVTLGAHAEYLAVPARRLARVPSGISHDDAAGVLFGGTTALYFLRDRASVGPGTTVLVNGASGAIGTNAVQLAAHLGATVVGVTSAPNAALVTELGATRVIDYAGDALATTAERFDVVLDTVGSLSIPSGRRLLRPGGKLLLAVAGLGETVRARGDVATGTSPERVADFEHLLGLVADGTLAVVHDRVPAMTPRNLDGIAEAHRRVDSGRKRGNIVVRP
ncbi:NAD(P)-dependent alcohol dehydrogenase [Pseudonocardia sp.]|uniref:NAD(P)-dependent alcohol dehydrogenase n=1 Tax=Pseudonocardia sp. TaxID=60912 RepID=UPI0026208E06|nr:NAD(P)-dependent alcohol dehydrogenase [Pseudonocardia sp.]